MNIFSKEVLSNQVCKDKSCLLSVFIPDDPIKSPRNKTALMSQFVLNVCKIIYKLW